MGIPNHSSCFLRSLSVGQEATIDWFKIEKRVQQGFILSSCLFYSYAIYIMWNARLNESQAGIEITGRNIKNLRCADDTTPIGGREEELKSLFIYLFIVSWRKIALKYYVGFLHVCSVLVTKSCQTLATPWTIAWQAPLHGMSQARMLEWVAIFFSRGSSWPRDQTCISCIEDRLFTTKPQRRPVSAIYQCKSDIIIHISPPPWSSFPFS